MRSRMTSLIAFTRIYPHRTEATTSCDNEQCRGSWTQGWDLGLETELGGKFFSVQGREHDLGNGHIVCTARTVPVRALSGNPGIHIPHLLL